MDIPVNHNRTVNRKNPNLLIEFNISPILRFNNIETCNNDDSIKLDKKKKKIELKSSIIATRLHILSCILGVSFALYGTNLLFSIIINTKDNLFNKLSTSIYIYVYY